MYQPNSSQRNPVMRYSTRVLHRLNQRGNLNKYATSSHQIICKYRENDTSDHLYANLNLSLSINFNLMIVIFIDSSSSLKEPNVLLNDTNANINSHQILHPRLYSDTLLFSNKYKTEENKFTLEMFCPTNICTEPSEILV